MTLLTLTTPLGGLVLMVVLQRVEAWLGDDTRARTRSG